MAEVKKPSRWATAAATAAQSSQSEPEPIQPEPEVEPVEPEVPMQEPEPVPAPVAPKTLTVMPPKKMEKSPSSQESSQMMEAKDFAAQVVQSISQQQVVPGSFDGSVEARKWNVYPTIEQAEKVKQLQKDLVNSRGEQPEFAEMMRYLLEQCDINTFAGFPVYMRKIKQKKIEENARKQFESMTRKLQNKLSRLD